MEKWPLGMTRPKKWYLDSCSSDGKYHTALKSADGVFLKKPNATSFLGAIQTVEVPEEQQCCGKYTSSECVLVSVVVKCV